jgi:hypothetical protein
MSAVVTAESPFASAMPHASFWMAAAVTSSVRILDWLMAEMKVGMANEGERPESRAQQ